MCSRYLLKINNYARERKCQIEFHELYDMFPLK
jgi:hypothetical protein